MQLLFARYISSAVGNGHSGYVDLWLELGHLGVACAALFVAWLVVVVLVLIDGDRFDEMCFVIAFMVFLLLYNVTEKTFLEHSEITSTITLAMSFELGRLLLRRVASADPSSGRRAAAGASVRRRPGGRLVAPASRPLEGSAS